MLKIIRVFTTTLRQNANPSAQFKQKVITFDSFGIFNMFKWPLRIKTIQHDSCHMGCTWKILHSTKEIIVITGVKPAFQKYRWKHVEPSWLATHWAYQFLKGWSQNRVKIFYLYNVKIALLTPSPPSIFTNEFELLSLQAKIIRPPPSPLSLHCKHCTDFDSIPKALSVTFYIGTIVSFQWEEYSTSSQGGKCQNSSVCGKPTSLHFKIFFLRVYLTKNIWISRTFFISRVSL